MNATTNLERYIAPAYRNQPHAAEFADVLAERLDWEWNDFDTFAWEADIPHESMWDYEIECLNNHLATL